DCRLHPGDQRAGKLAFLTWQPRAYPLRERMAHPLDLRHHPLRGRPHMLIGEYLRRPETIAAVADPGMEGMKGRVIAAGTPRPLDREPPGPPGQQASRHRALRQGGRDDPYFPWRRLQLRP